MTQRSLLEVVRIRGMIARLRRQYGDEVTLEYLRRAIEAELVRPGSVPVK